MQPYFYPYGGYYRLLAEADWFVIFDCVQFNRRGRVHRCEVHGPQGKPEWLTLPLAHQPRDVLIRNLAFAGPARAELDRRLRRHEWLTAGRGYAAEAVLDHLHQPLSGVVDFLEAGLRLVADLHTLPAKIVRSSSLAIDTSLRGQDRVIAIVQALNGSAHLASPGGRKLYSQAVFAEEGLSLDFLAPYHGPHVSVLHALHAGTNIS
ncbi:WbqC family protein [Aminobacter sp. HY435]|uniref:WbqC family protein n=1 Tax=Aminobacter sp. HY435 TaxID=2970917 RepID=UPI0022B97D19|nr:WbqC family protein [Aminobacter sp. HY435]